MSHWGLLLGLPHCQLRGRLSPASESVQNGNCMAVSKISGEHCDQPSGFPHDEKSTALHPVGSKERGSGCEPKNKPGVPRCQGCLVLRSLGGLPSSRSWSFSKLDSVQCSCQNYGSFILRKLCLASYFLRCLWALSVAMRGIQSWFFPSGLGLPLSSQRSHLAAACANPSGPTTVAQRRHRSHFGLHSLPPREGGLERCESDGATCSAKWSLCLVLFLHCFLKRLLQRVTTKARSPDSLFVGCIHICRLWGCDHSVKEWTAGALYTLDCPGNLVLEKLAVPSRQAID